MEYFVLVNESGTEYCLCARTNFHQNLRDTYNNQMEVLEAFEAPSWEAAKEKYEETLEWHRTLICDARENISK